ncbi:Protein CBG26421 [Caenorhabditis briggsae]|uniref:Protein CBG26421 n=1 Tax=Caenorhabditis briggsae TaxID=6238 RepID=B6ILF4_CAEBR|nr:Protein CBG26421 [Caenorhabditis briggsae]CAS00734.1 Protein CBG26421 [Caenorhabditis briggsae]
MKKFSLSDGSKNLKTINLFSSYFFYSPTQFVYEHLEKRIVECHENPYEDGRFEKCRRFEEAYAHCHCCCFGDHSDGVLRLAGKIC